MTLLTSNSNMSLIILLMRNAATHTSTPPAMRPLLVIGICLGMRRWLVRCSGRLRNTAARFAHPTCPRLSTDAHKRRSSFAPPSSANAFATRTSSRLRTRCLTVFRKRWRLRARSLLFARRKRGKALGCDGKLRCSSSSTGASASFACWPQAVPRKAFCPF